MEEILIPPSCSNVNTLGIFALVFLFTPYHVPFLVILVLGTLMYNISTLLHFGII